MRNLLVFILKNSHVFLFVFLEILCFAFIYQSGSYRQWVMNTASKEISGPILQFRAGYREYVHLKKINAQLMDENQRLIHEAYNRTLTFSPLYLSVDSNRMPVFEYIQKQASGLNRPKDIEGKKLGFGYRLHVLIFGFHPSIVH